MEKETKVQYQNRYTDAFRVSALAAVVANRGNISKTAKQLGMPYATLRLWTIGERHPEALAMAEGVMGDLAQRLETVAHEILDAIPDKIENSSGPQLAVMLGITVDKMQLLRNRPTSINGTQDLDSLSDDELDKRIAEAEAGIIEAEAEEAGEDAGEEEESVPD